ncbi:MAG TPA: hypothetical protein PKB09_00410 [Candidatus Saccharibacteria bacterium]|nr:hypothetical protein [Candidatus Saccharibacteria bacterium]
MFDAYTVKKVLPRLAIAVILIQLSWFLTTGAIFLTNQIAYGIQGLMYGAFGGTADFTLEALLSGTSSSSATTIGTTVLFSVVGIAFGGGVLAIAAFIVIAVLVAFLSLAVRRALLILLVLLAPIAIVAWILPNTERFWKMWWDNFTKLLLMFPMIMAMIAAGRIFAKISGTTGGNDIVKVTIVLAGFFVPLLLIPKTFSLAGSAFAAMGGAIAQRGAGAQNWAQGMGKKRQTQKWGKRGQDFMGGNMKERTALGRRVNRVGAGLGVGASNRFGLGKRGREAVKIKKQVAETEAAKNPELQSMMLNNDDATALLGLSGGTSEGMKQAQDELRNHWYEQQRAKGVSHDKAMETANARIAQATAAARAVGVTKTNAAAAFNGLAQNKARSLGAGATGLVAAGASRLADGNDSKAAEALGAFQYHARGAGRFDLGADSAAEGADKASLYQLANAQPSTIEAVGEEMLTRMSTGDPQSMHQALVFRQELDAMIPNATGATRDALVEQRERLDSIGRTAPGTPGALANFMRAATGRIDPATGAPATVTYTENYDQERARTDATYRREWQSDPVGMSTGKRLRTRAETNADVAHADARTYRAPEEENR